MASYYCGAALAAFLLVCNQFLTVVEANCNLTPEIKESGKYGDWNFHDKDLTGGNQNIDKITQIRVFTGTYYTNKVSLQELSSRNNTKAH